MLISFLILKKRITFEVGEVFCASKSSISASINFLLNANLIKPSIKLMKENDILSLMMIL